MRNTSHTTVVKELKSGDIVRLDFRWSTVKKRVSDFAINVSILKDEKSIDVYRVDTKHKHLHEQKFWKSPRPMPIDMDYNDAFIKKKEEVFNNYERWVKLFKIAKNRGEING